MKKKKFYGCLISEAFVSYLKKRTVASEIEAKDSCVDY